jgi:hypothetical protein
VLSLYQRGWCPTEWILGALSLGKYGRDEKQTTDLENKYNYISTSPFVFISWSLAKVKV